MPTITVYALEAMDRDGVTYPKGAPIEMPAIQAAVEKYRGRVSLTPLAVEAYAPPTEDRPKRRYRRRDLQADDTREMTVEGD